MSITPNATIAKIGNFFGTKVAELMALISARPTVDQVRAMITESNGSETNASTAVSYSFGSSLTPVIAHNTGKQVAHVSIYDSTGRQHFAPWTKLDNDRIKLEFTEAVQGDCIISFHS